MNSVKVVSSTPISDAEAGAELGAFCSRCVAAAPASGRDAAGATGEDAELEVDAAPVIDASFKPTVNEEVLAMIQRLADNLVAEK
mmetsp:Transcript_56396/g.156157  ORF Transcript_56396/g.156157 Transcript_56396/m.156157 type:complete len:85 (-) Transcript_56396:529-783(-)